MGQPTYHATLAFLGALVYGFPSRRIKVVGITGTKGKSTTAELVNAVLEAAGHSTALMNTIRFKIADESRPNLYKMSMPGRFFMQRFLRDAVRAGCDWVVLEMTSEGARFFRHTWIALDALIFTNLAPEHIESHGSYEKYRDAKLSIAKLLEPKGWPRKRDTVIVANADDVEGKRFLAINATRAYPYRLDDAKPYAETSDGYSFSFNETKMSLHIPGLFNLMNALGAATFARSQAIANDVIARGLSNVTGVRGRVEFVREGQPFDVVVDYAHTSDSLEALYTLFKNKTTVCVLGNTGGGRDTWKRPSMAATADRYCSHIILTNEDPYDEDPRTIIDAMAEGVKTKTKLRIIMDRREAIREALRTAKQEHETHPHDRVAVLITGKGTDPYIMGPNGSKTPWDDATVVREEIKNI